MKVFFVIVVLVCFLGLGNCAIPETSGKYSSIYTSSISTIYNRTIIIELNAYANLNVYW